MVHIYALKQDDTHSHPKLSSLFVRHIAVQFAGLKDEDVVFANTATGKPFIQNLPHFHFNVSHSGQWLVCATDTQPVGIDIEKILPLDVLAYREQLSVAEYYSLRAMPAAHQLEHFYELWTLKESYLKLTGAGINAPMNSLTMQLIGNNYQVLNSFGRKTEGIFFKTCTLDSAYKLAVCATKNSFSDVKVVTIP